MIGEYDIALSWGEASLRLDADQTFREVLRPRSGESHQVSGKWTLNPSWQAQLFLEPYWEFTQDDPGTKVMSAVLPVESWGFKDVRIEFGDPDSRIKLRKQ